MVKLRNIIMIHELERQGLSISEIARKTGLNRKTVRKYLARGLEAPVYGPRAPRARRLDPYKGYLREQITTCEGLSGRLLHREIQKIGYAGGYSAVTAIMRKLVHPGQHARQAGSGLVCRLSAPHGRRGSVRKDLKGLP